MTTDRRLNVPRPLSIPWLLGLLTLAGVIGGVVFRGLTIVGAQGRTPDQRFSALERYDSTRRTTVDSLFHIQQAQISNLTDLTMLLVTVRCLDADREAIEAARRARVPCAKILRDQGISP